MENNNGKKEKNTGRYVYDKKLNKVVKISDEIVGIKKSDDSSSEIPSGPSCSSGGCCPGCGIN